MRFGVTGMIPGDFNEIDEQLARRIAELGFTGVGAHLAGDPAAVTLALCQQVRAVLAGQGLQIIQFWGFYSSLVSPDESIRQTGVRQAQAILALAAPLGAAMVGIRPTSMNPLGVWWPHPDNYTPATEERLVRSLREIAVACEVHGIPIALECHVTTTLSSAHAVRRIIENTGSPWVKVTMDPVNFVDSLWSAYHTRTLLNECFELLGPYIVAAHIKDVYVENRHVVHISETIPGDGLLDFDTFFTRFEALLPDGYAFIEHLPESQIAQAAAFVNQKLKQLGISIR